MHTYMKTIYNSPIPNQHAIRLFKYFIVTHLAYKQAVQNIQNHSNMYTPHISRLSKISPTSYLCIAFPWSLTPQGSTYWNSLNDKWNKLYRQFQNRQQPTKI